MEARRPSNQAVDTREADPRLKSAKPRSRNVRSLAARAGCGILIAVAGLLALPVLTQAQTTVWSSTLTVQDGGTVYLGCSQFIDSPCSANLSDNDFTYDRTTYKFLIIYVYPPDFLRIDFDNNITTATQNLTLNVDGRSFAFEDATTPFGHRKLWDNAGLSWTAGDTVTLTLTDPNGTPGEPETPAAPSVGATAGSNTSLDVGWLEPANAGPDVNYYLRYRFYRPETGATGSWFPGHQNVAIKFSTIGNLIPSANYQVQVLANNNNGDSEWSPWGTGRTDSGEAPGAPTNLNATANGQNRVDLNWTAPSSEGGTIPSNPGEPDSEMEDDRIRSYKIEVRSAASNWLVLDRTIGSADTVYSHRDVPAGVIRCYRVSATNTAGTGLPSNEAVATTDGADGTCDRPPTPDPQMQQSQTPLTASFVSVPATHDGETPFWLELSFDAPLAQGSKPQLRELLDVTGGLESRFRRKDGRLDHWQIRVDPSSQNAVTVMLSPSPPCGETGAVCTEDGRTFTTGLGTQIHGPASGNNNWSGDVPGDETAVTPVPALPLASIGLLGLVLAILGWLRRPNDHRRIDG